MDGEEFGKELQIVYDAVQMGREAGAGYEFWAALSRNERLFSKVARIVEHAEKIPPGKLFVYPDSQMEFIQLQLAIELNREYGWGFGKDDFAELLFLPERPKGRFSALVLDIHLESPAETFEAAYSVLRRVQKKYGADMWRWDGLNPRKNLRLMEGITYKSGIKWQKVNFAANWNKKSGLKPEDICTAERSPHSAALWGAAFSPRLVQSMNGKDVPYIWLTGYEVRDAESKEWTGVPTLRWNATKRAVEISVSYRGSSFSEWAIPELCE